jgi:NADH:ubiquinone oxidoreductase subunit 3 (subunit A)
MFVQSDEYNRISRMGSVIMMFFVQNVFLFCIIFWVITWLAEWFYSKKEQTAKKQFYECGFKSISDINIQLNLNFSLVCVFLILYDVEFTFLFPLLFNFSMLDNLSFYMFLFFVSLLILALVYDLSHTAISTTL